MRTKGFVCTLLACTFTCSWHTQAAVNNYSSDKPGFESATAGFSKTMVDFDDGSVNEGDILATQYAPQNALFSTATCEYISAEPSAYGPGAYSPPLCANVYREESTANEIHSSFTIDFPETVWGMSVYVLDINNGEYVRLQVFDDASQEIASYDVDRQGDYTYLAALSDSKNIGSVIVTCDLLGDGIGFDDVTIVPEPATVSLLGLGALPLVRGRRRLGG